MVRPRMRLSDAFVALWPATVLVGLGAAGYLVLLDWVVAQEDLYLLDQPLLEWLAENRTPAVMGVLEVVTTAFGPLVMPGVVAAIAGVWWLTSRSWWHPALLVGAMVLSTSLTLALKAAHGRDRPLADLMAIPGYETTASFPSGHTIGAATLVLVVGYLLWHGDADAPWRLTAWTVLSFAIVGTVALSRMYLGYHFLTDVLAGACVGVAVVGVVVGIERWRDLALERTDPPPRPLSFAEVARLEQEADGAQADDAQADGAQADDAQADDAQADDAQPERPGDDQSGDDRPGGDTRAAATDEAPRG